MKLIIYLLLGLSSIIYNGKEPNKKDNVLKGKKIVITAPKIYASRLKTTLEKHGAEVIELNSIETIVYKTLKELRQYQDKPLKLSNRYKYIVLPSRNAIKAFYNHDKGASKNKYFYVIGKDKELLKKLGYPNYICPKESSMHGIAKAIKSTKNKKKEELLLIVPKVSLIPEPNVVPNFIHEIEKMGIRCHKIYGYTTRPIINNHNKKIIENIKKGKYHLIAFTSGGEIFAISKMIKPKDIKCKIACFGPYTASNAKIVNIKVDMISKKYHSFNDYANSIIEFLNSKK